MRRLLLAATLSCVTLGVDAQQYPSGTRLRLTAAPDLGATFDGWTGDIAGNSNPIEITLTADTAITATFSTPQPPPPPPPQDPALTVTVVGPGSVSVTVVQPPSGVYDLLSQNLPPSGQWLKLPGSEIGPVLTGANEFSYCAEIKCFRSGDVLKVWSGMEIDLATGNWYLPASGGHADYGGNEVYRFSLGGTLTWTRDTIPQPLTGPETALGCPLPATGPPAGHLYDNLVWMPTRQELFMPRGSGFCAQGSSGPEGNRLWTYAPATKTWTRLPYSYPEHAWMEDNQYQRCDYDPTRDRVYCAGGSNAAWFREFDPQNNYALVGDASFQTLTSWTGMALFDQQTRNIYFTSEMHGPSKMHIALDGTKSSSAWLLAAQAWPTGFEGTTAIALAPNGDLIAWHGDHRVLRIRLDGTTEDLTPTTGFFPPPVFPSEGGRVYSKWEYIPQVDAFVGISDGLSGVFVYRLPASSASLPTVEDEKATYLSWGWSWSAAQEPSAVTEPFANYRIANPDHHHQTEGDDLWSYAQMYRRSGNPVYLRRAEAWRRYFVEDYLDCVGTTMQTYCFDRDAYGAEHQYGYGLLAWYEHTGDTEALAEAKLAGAEVERLWSPSSSYDCYRQSGCMIYGPRGLGRHLLLVSELARITGELRWLQLREQILDVLKGENSGWDPVRGMYWTGEWSTDTILGRPGAYAAGDRIQSGFMIAVLAEGIWRAWLDTRDATLRERIVAMARYIQAHGVGADEYTGATFGWVNNAPWHTDPQAEYTAGLSNLLVMGFKFTGDRSLYERGKYMFNRGTKTRTGHFETRTPDNVVDHFIDTQLDTASGNVYLDRNKGELLYTYLLFENGGEPSVLY